MTNNDDPCCDECREWRTDPLAALVADLDRWAGRSKTGFYDEAQDDVTQILKPYRKASK